MDGIGPLLSYNGGWLAQIESPDHVQVLIAIWQQPLCKQGIPQDTRVTKEISKCLRALSSKENFSNLRWWSQIGRWIMDAAALADWLDSQSQCQISQWNSKRNHGFVTASFQISIWIEVGHNFAQLHNESSEDISHTCSVITEILIWKFPSSQLPASYLLDLFTLLHEWSLLHLRIYISKGSWVERNE